MTEYKFTDLRIPMYVTRPYLEAEARKLGIAPEKMLSRMRMMCRVEVIEDQSSTVAQMS
jgi:hypothetical protein